MGKTPRPGASLINMHATSQNLGLSSSGSPNPTTSGGRRMMRGGSVEHLGSHEHQTYAYDDLDDTNSPPPSTYRYQTGYGQAMQSMGSYGGASPAGYGSPRQTPSSLRANRAAVFDPYVSTPATASPVTGLHPLHSKGSNLSTNTFMPRSHDRDRDRENGMSGDLLSPGAVTPKAADMAPFTPLPPNVNPNTNGNNTTPKATSAEPAPRTAEGVPQSAVSSSSSTVVKAKSSAVTAVSSPRAQDRRSSRRERDKDREGDHRRAKIRTIPHLPHGSAEAAPSTLMYWSRAPVYGHLPTRAMRAHSVTLVDNVAWLFGGCDERGCARDVWCCDVETFQWTHPSLTGDIPPPCRAHTATLVDGKRIFIFGGGEGPTYYNTLYILDTQTRRFTWVPCGQKPPTTVTPTEATAAAAAGTPVSGPSSTSTPSTTNPPLPNSAAPQASSSTTSVSTPNGVQSSTKDLPPPPMPLPRRAHTAVLYRSKLYIFGGGNGVKALNDVWCLDTSVPVEKMRWEQIKTSGSRPGPRGYHTANLVGNIMIIVGGSDGRECFSDIWVLNLDTLVWTLVDTDKEYKRLSHSSTQVGSYLFIMGGHDGLKYSSDLLLFNLVTLQYEHKQTMGKPPPARGYHISLLADARLLVYGGFDGHSVFDDVWLLDLAGAAYLPQVTSFALLIDSGH